MLSVRLLWQGVQSKNKLIKIYLVSQIIHTYIKIEIRYFVNLQFEKNRR